MEDLPRYKASQAFVGLGNKNPQPFVRGDSQYAPSGPQGSRLVSSENLFNLQSKPIEPSPIGSFGGGGGGGGQYSLTVQKQSFTICFNGSPTTVELVSDVILNEE
jgi:hypothetical protein